MIHPLSFRFMGIGTTTEGQEQPKRTKVNKLSFDCQKFVYGQI